MSSVLYTESFITGPQDTQFYTRVYVPPSPLIPKAIVVLVHGFNDHIERYTNFHNTFAQRGIAAFAFDQRGFGRTTMKKENGAGKKYAQTSWREQFEDIEWAIKEAKKVEGFGDLPVFMMGHSMGGGLSLAFPTRTQPAWPHPSAETVSLLSGVISTSPLIILTHPKSGIIRWVGGKAALITPRMTIPAVVEGKYLSHDPTIGEAIPSDSLIRQIGSLRGMSDMLNGGEELLKVDYKNWPRSLSLLLTHGSEDQVTSHKASEAFFEKLEADDKKLSIYEGAYHEVHNEPDGVKEKFIDELIVWIEGHLPASAEPAMAISDATPASKL